MSLISVITTSHLEPACLSNTSQVECTAPVFQRSTCVLQGMLTGTSQRSKHLHTGEKSSAPLLCDKQTHIPPRRWYPWTSQAGQVPAVSEDCGGTAQLLGSSAVGAGWRESSPVTVLMLQAAPQPPRISPPGEAWTSSSNLGKNSVLGKQCLFFVPW